MQEIELPNGSLPFGMALHFYYWYNFHKITRKWHWKWPVWIELNTWTYPGMIWFCTRSPTAITIANCVCVCKPIMSHSEAFAHCQPAVCAQCNAGSFEPCLHRTSQQWSTDRLHHLGVLLLRSLECRLWATPDSLGHGYIKVDWMGVCP